MDYIEQIKSQLQITNVATTYGLKVNSRNFCTCPFHRERTASLKFYENNTFYCFGCGKGGDIISLVMELHGISFKQAIVRLDYDFGLGLCFSSRPTAKEIYRLKKLEKERILNQEKERITLGKHEEEKNLLLGLYRVFHFSESQLAKFYMPYIDALLEQYEEKTFNFDVKKFCFVALDELYEVNILKERGVEF